MLYEKHYVICKTLTAYHSLVGFFFSDWSYVPKYNNADDSGEYKVANGFSYHQGPVSRMAAHNIRK